MLNKIFVQEAPTAIAMFDREMRYIAVSQKWLSDYGITDRTVVGKSHYEIFPEIGEEWKKIHAECLEGKININHEARFLRKDGTEQWLEWEVRPWYSADNVIGGIIMYTADITERRQIKQQLLLSEEQFRSAFEYSPIGIALVSLEGNWIKVNNALCEIVGYHSEDLLRMNFQDITHPEDLDRDLKLVKDTITGRRAYYQIEKRYIHKAGHIIWVILSVSLVRNTAGKALYFISQVTDITGQKTSQAKLELTLSKLEGLFNAATQVSIISVDPSGLITEFNHGAENLLGYNRHEVIGIHTPELIHLRKEIEQRGKELSAQTGRTVSGFDVFIERAKAIEYETREWTYVRKNGTCFPVQLTVTAVREQGEIAGYLGIAVDISERKRTETEIKSLLEVSKDQNERLKNFAHIVSHNLRSHSGNISVLLELFLHDHPELNDSELVQSQIIAANNLRETIAHLNEVVMMNSTVDENLKSLKLITYVDAAIVSISALAAEAEVTIRNTVDPDLYVQGVEAYLDSIILNFLTNGIKYKAPGVQSFIHVASSLTPDYVILSFRDNGLGMDMKLVRQKLFGMYKTFHGNADARGIGLFVSKNQVDAIGGKIEADSTINSGTTFNIYLRHGKR